MHHTDMDKATNAVNSLFQGKEDCIDREQVLKFVEQNSDVLKNVNQNTLTKDCYRRDELLQQVQGGITSMGQGIGMGGGGGTGTIS